MKKQLTIITYLIFTILFVTPINIYAYDYEINKYDISIEVLENNVMNITENIGAYFNVPKHGIYRKIPLRNKVSRLDGTTETNRAKVSNVSVNEKFSLSNSDGYRVIKIGNPDKTLTGQSDYSISYQYNLGKDKGKKYDELYFNIIGSEWDTSISNITFKVSLPKDFDYSKIGFSSGAIGSTDSSKINYNVDGNTIVGNYDGNINPGEALTIRIELPEGYFVGASNNIEPFVYIIILLSILFPLISILLWFKYGKDEQVVETVEFYPPEGFNSCEVGFLYKGKVDKNDVVSLLIYLANKGYISIKEIEKKTLFSTKPSFIIKKEKEYDGNNESEKTFLDGLFKKNRFSGLTISILNKNLISSNEDDGDKITEVKEEDLVDSFYVTLNKILNIVNSKKNKNLIYEKSSMNKLIFVKLMIIVQFLALFFICIYTGDSAMVVVLILFIMIYLICISLKNIEMVLSIVFGILFFASIPTLTLLFSGNIHELEVSLNLDFVYIATMFVCLVSIIIMQFMHNILLKRNSFGNEVLGKIRGFKNFLETAEKEKLEALVESDPTYFYDILPFTYVLGVSDKWIKKFESIAIEAPNWYEGNSSFNMVTFGSFMNSTMSSATTAMSSSPSSSGGGSSGGGSGGGGGGSW